MQENARSFENMQTVYGVALPKVYILVHFWQRVSAMLKHRFSDRMSVVPNSNEFFIYEKFEVQKCPPTDISERWHPVPLLKILNVQKARLRLFFTRALRLKRQAAFSGIHRNIGLADEGSRKQLFGEFVFEFGLDSSL